MTDEEIERIKHGQRNRRDYKKHRAARQKYFRLYMQDYRKGLRRRPQQKLAA